MFACCEIAIWRLCRNSVYMSLTMFYCVFMIAPQGEVHVCTLKWPDVTGEIVWNIAFTALCFLIPGIVIVLSYSKILQVGISCC